MKCKFMYKAVDEKRYLQELAIGLVRKSTLVELCGVEYRDVQICMVQYEVTKIGMSTEKMKVGIS